jgi:hypothetical protein
VSPRPASRRPRVVDAVKIEVGHMEMHPLEGEILQALRLLSGMGARLSPASKFTCVLWLAIVSLFD